MKRINNTTGDRVTVIIINIFLILVGIAVLYPLYFVVVASISDPAAVNSGKTLLAPVNPSLTGYRYIFKDYRILTGYQNTIIYTLFGTAFGLIITVLGGYALSRSDMPGSNIIMKLAVFTMYFSGGLVPTYMVVKGMNLINTRLVLIILGSFSVYNLIVTRTFFLSKIPPEFREAASIDGCGNGRFLISIVLPLSKEILAVIGLFYAVSDWNSFFNALIYVNDQNLYPLQLFLRDMLITTQTLVGSEMDPDAMQELQKIAETIKYGVIIVSSLPVLILYPFVQKYFVKGVMIGGIKG